MQVLELELTTIQGLYHSIPLPPFHYYCITMLRTKLWSEGGRFPIYMRAW